MASGVKEEKMASKGGLKCFKLILLLMNISNSVAPATGFSLRYCRISLDSAICSKNEPRLRAVPRDVPPTIKRFDLSANKISKIKVSDFQNLTLLTQLDLNNNIISQIDPHAFASLTSLKRLNLNNNQLYQLEDDTFDGLSNLTELRIHQNKIKRLASACFKPLTSLTFLDISNNRLHHLIKVGLILQQLPNLRVLSVKRNDLPAFQSWEVANSSLELKSLDLSQNPIAVFRITADVFPNLTSINIGQTLRKQPIKWDVHERAFLSRVKNLDISGVNSVFSNTTRFLEMVNSSLTFLRMNEMRHNLAELINVSCGIPTMSKLSLRKNRLFFIRSTLFQLCVNVTELDLADNVIQNVQDSAFASVPGLRILSLSHNRLSSVPAATRNLRALSELDLGRNNISVLECHDFANLTKLRHLYLDQNSISALKECLFKDLIQLQVLKLHSNTISKLSGAFRHYLTNLRQLRLNSNKLKTIKRGEFRGLTSLQNLSLHENAIEELEKGSFIGLTNLTVLQLQSNKIKKQEIHKGALSDLINLRSLDLRNNQIRYDNSSALPEPPFSKLSSLEVLAMLSQRHRGKAHLPSNILQGLTNLLVFNTRNIQLLSLPKGMFNYTPRLQTLDISSNDLTDLSSDLFLPIQSLLRLYVSRTNLRSLDFLIEANLTELQFMQARRNTYSVISEEVMRSLPALVYVDLQGNSFSCDCDNAWFIQWVLRDNQTQVFDAYNFECNYPPDLKGLKLLDFDVQSCSVNTDFICFISTTCATLLIMVASFTYHFLRWHLTYAYYFFLAVLFDAKNKNKQTLNQYDAFISYNAHDEPWVIRELLPKLEGEQGWRLCLHHRDFEPGKPIIENITDAIYGSRKTICVISRRYLESEWCSREIQVASFRLFDEQKDVLILVFLEDIPARLLSPFHRMRKLLKRRTYLSWPQAADHPELFWEKLRQALRTREELGNGKFHLTVMGGL